MARTKQQEHAQNASHGRASKTGLDRANYLIRSREFAARGFDLPQTKLPPLAVVAIRQAARERERMRQEINEKYSNAALAKAWGVHVRTIEKVLSYETGAHIP